LGLRFQAKTFIFHLPLHRTVEVAKGEGRKGWSAKSTNTPQNHIYKGGGPFENLLKILGWMRGFWNLLALYSLFLLKSIKQNGNCGTRQNQAIPSKGIDGEGPTTGPRVVVFEVNSGCILLHFSESCLILLDFCSVGSRFPLSTLVFGPAPL